MKDGEDGWTPSGEEEEEDRVPEVRVVIVVVIWTRREGNWYSML